jgi:hypothetical protein
MNSSPLPSFLEAMGRGEYEILNFQVSFLMKVSPPPF